MTTRSDELAGKFAELTRWERRKRFEETALAACCAALGAAIVLLPLNVFLPGTWLRWLVPAILLAGGLPVFLYRRRWTAPDEVRALAALDRALNLEERALTAWNLLERRDDGAPAQLVYRRAREQLRTAEPRALFPRRRSWTVLLTPALLGFWLMLLWFGTDRPADRSPPKPPTLAQKAREYAREFQEKARSEGLRESLKMGQDLESLARRGIEKKTEDEQFRKELDALARKFDEAVRARGEMDPAAAESRQALEDLRAELAAVRDLPELPELPKGAEDPGRRWAERLASMPQLKRRLDQANPAGENSGSGDFRAFLDRLERNVAGELDRRALLDAQRYLEQMMKQGRQAEGENFAQRHPVPGGDDPAAGKAQREKSPSSLPGSEPGETSDAPSSLPEFRAESATHVKGALGAGESTALSFKAKPVPGKGPVTPSADVVASYRRQAEQELDSERVPAALKQTIKNYFLSLGDTEKRSE